MDKIWAKDVKEGERARSVFLVSRKAVPTAKSGKPYLSATLQDKTGELEARAFDRVEELAQLFEEKDYVEVDGQVGTFQGKPQLRIEQLTKVDPASLEASEFVWIPPPEPKKPEKAGFSEQEETTWRELAALVDAVTDPHVKGLIRAFLEDDDVAARLRRAPAAKTVHHAYPGGLLEHTVSCLKLAHRLADHYPQMDRDLLVAGAFFHDLGKIRELSFDRQVEYSDEGRLVGHLVMTAQWIHDKARRVGIPRDLEQHIVHLVLSHHGKLEFGSPKVPMTLEAVITHEIDELDSRVNSWLNLMGRDGGSRRWTDSANVYGQHIWRGTLPTVQAEKKGPPPEVMTPVIYIPRDTSAAQANRGGAPGQQQNKKKRDRPERKHEAPREVREPREPREPRPEGAPSGAEAPKVEAGTQPPARHERPERSERPEQGDRPPRGDRRPERGERGGAFRGPGGAGDRKRGYTGPRLPGDRGPPPRPKAPTALTHNPFAALAQKIESAGEGGLGGAGGEAPTATEAEVPSASTSAPPPPETAAAAAPDVQPPPARHEAEPGSMILADAGVGRTVPPSEADIGSGERSEPSGEGGGEKAPDSGEPGSGQGPAQS